MSSGAANLQGFKMTFLESKFKVTGQFCAPIILYLILSTTHAAEQGDFDGDGRLSIRDVVSFMEGHESAPGSLDGFDEDPDLVNLPDDLSEVAKRGFYAGLTYIEFLRRSVADPLQHWMEVTN